ncbi:hypothetical protein DPMN_161093 [Dreissena polymorpha]|uniref:Uncharacterized protein n=1 Tax=Dreissena polymorpha TaxID=45954 RepID=A0A9D4ESE7_DREPO|nr:hypothetical protein DPMN_161093 [Dreissena polymorpha]
MQARKSADANQEKPFPSADANQEKPFPSADANQEKPFPSADANQEKPFPSADANQEKPFQSADANQDLGRSRAINTDESNHTTGGAQRIFVKCGLIVIHGLTNST